jgi:hypothetical protein
LNGEPLRSLASQFAAGQLRHDTEAARVALSHPVILTEDPNEFEKQKTKV